MFARLKAFLRAKNRSLSQIPEIHSLLFDDRKSFKVNLGQIQARLNNQLESIGSLSDVEFQVFSQWGDDGIIQYINNKIRLPETFIEFGVETYRESNTRFLLINNNFSGLVIDGDKKNIDYINSDEISWHFDLHAVHGFITKENINITIQDFLDKGYPKEIGVLSIDIDGNDYWVWDEINVVNPVLVIVEYNSVFGPENAWTIPYNPEHYGIGQHHSRYYWGASLNAFCRLGQSKGYSLIGCNSNGNNAYFLRKDKLGPFRELSSAEAFIDAKFRLHSKTVEDKTFGQARIGMLKGKEIFDVTDNSIKII